MAGSTLLLVQALIAQGRAQGVPPNTALSGATGQVVPNLDGTGPSSTDSAAQAWLQQLVASLAADIIKYGDRHITSTSLNGKSVQFAQTTTKREVMEAAQTALNWLASGYQGPTTELYGRAF